MTNSDSQRQYNLTCKVKSNNKRFQNIMIDIRNNNTILDGHWQLQPVHLRKIYILVIEIILWIRG